MEQHEYTPEQALQLLLEMVGKGNQHLRDEMQRSIDLGKDIQESETSNGRKRGERTYRKVVQFTPEEALRIAIDVLETHFIHSGQIINSLLSEIRSNNIGYEEYGWKVRDFTTQNVRSKEIAVLEEKPDQVQIELKSETQMTELSKETEPLKAIDNDLLNKQFEQIQKLRELLTFTEQ